MERFQYLIVPFVTLIMCQLIKFTIESIKEKRLKWGRLFNGSGGMPSSHSSFCFSITMLLGYTQGFTTPLFALALVFSFIVCYDAMGLRMESSKQAMAINYIIDEIFEVSPKQGLKHLKEQLGHKPIEVLMGILLGTIVSFIFVFVV